MMTSNKIHRDATLEDEKNECSCPICLRTSTELRIDQKQANERAHSNNQKRSTVFFAYSRTCGHIYCFPCIQQILLTPSVAHRTATARQIQEDEQLVTTTQGACPMCRAELSYFDLMKVIIGETSDEEHFATITKSEDPVVSSDPIPQKLRDAKFTSPESHLQFPADMTEVTSSFVTLAASCLENDVPDGKLELTGYRYLAKTHTFIARTKKTATIPDTEFTVWLHFSDDFQFITNGLCRKVIRKKFYEEVVGVLYPELRTKLTTWVYPLSTTDSTRMCRVNPPRVHPTIRHHQETFWGSIFCDEFVIGVASHHFVKKPSVPGSDDGPVAYISYEHKATSDWPPLDNGRPIPSRVFFRNISCPDQHTFRGSICWYDDFQTTWTGDSRWDYDIKFDSFFMCIISGTVRKIRMNHNDTNSLGSDETISMETFGVDLNYINAGICSTMIESFLTSIFERLTVRHSLPELSPSDMILTSYFEQLNSEGVTPSTLLSMVCILHYTKDCLPEVFDRVSSEPGVVISANEYSPFDLSFYYEV